MSEFTQGEKMTVALMNQKTVYVGAAAPSAKYDGQVWVCTSSDPPLVKVYDTTNTQWMEHHQIIYEARNSGQFPATTPILNGAVAVVYDQQQSSAIMYARAGGSWRNMGGSLTRVYPVGGTQKTVIISGGAGSLSWGASFWGESGVETILVSTNITPTNSGDYVVAFIGGSIRPNYYSGEKLRLYIGTTKVADVTMNPPSTKALTSGAVCSNTSTNVYAAVYCLTKNTIIHTGLGLGVVSVKT